MRCILLLLMTLLGCTPRESYEDPSSKYSDLERVELENKRLYQENANLRSEIEILRAQAGTSRNVARVTAEEKENYSQWIRPVGENRFEVSRELFANASKHLTECRLIPAFKSGKAWGFKMFSVLDNSAWAHLGFKNGDIVYQVNGEGLTGPSEAMRVYESLKSTSRVVVKGRRRAKEFTYSYALTGEFGR